MKLFCHRKLLFWIGLAIGVLGLGLLGTSAASKIQAQRLQARLSNVQHKMDQGRLAVARKELADLAQHWPGDGQILYLLGRCEELLGRPHRALAAWAQVPVSDPEFRPRGGVTGGPADQSRSICSGRDVAPRCRSQGSGDQSVSPAPAHWLDYSGWRVDPLTCSDILTATWLHAPEPSEVLQDLWQNDTEPVPVDGWKVLLDEADQKDDRVWLGKARHAILDRPFRRSPSLAEPVSGATA